MIRRLLSYYAALAWDALWKSAGTFSRLVTIGLLGLTAASLVLPRAAAISLPTASTPIALALVVLLALLEVAVVNYRRVDELQQQVRA
jgi:hypothetical protein